MPPMELRYLDPINQSFADALSSSNGPPMESLPIADARAILENVNKHEYSADVVRETVDVESSHGRVQAIVSRPQNATGNLPVIFYFHGGGWILGSFATHEVIVSDIVHQTGACVIFPQYAPAPEAQFPVPFEQSYAVIKHFVEKGNSYGLRCSSIAFAGDSVGGHMAIAMSFLAAQRRLPARIVYQVLFYPVTDIAQRSESYSTFENGPSLTANMLQWMIEAEIPETADRESLLGSPLRMSYAELIVQPPTLVVVASVDPLRNEGLDFATKLQQAGVDTSVFIAQGQLHDFVLLLPIRSSPTAKATVELACLKLKNALAPSM